MHSACLKLCSERCIASPMEAIKSPISKNSVHLCTAATCSRKQQDKRTKTAKKKNNNYNGTDGVRKRWQI